MRAGGSLLGWYERKAEREATRQAASRAAQIVDAAAREEGRA